MDKTPAPLSLGTACTLPRSPGKSAEVLIDGDLEVRFTPRPTDGVLHTHERDELYFVAMGKGVFRSGGRSTEVSAGDLCFAAAHESHGFASITDDFAIWIVFYGPVK